MIAIFMMRIDGASMREARIRGTLNQAYSSFLKAVMPMILGEA